MIYKIQLVLLAAFATVLSGGQEVDECKDRLRSCHIYPKKEYCLSEKYGSFMERYCAHYCGFCDCNNWVYGCCRDRKTNADGPGGEGCSIKLCYDVFVDGCQDFKRNGTCRSASAETRAMLKERCPYSCGYCKHLAPSKRLCADSLYGCCWDGTRALGPNYKGCRPCTDTFPHSCKQFAVLGSCSNTGAYYTRTFLEKHCPMACGVCPVASCHDRAGEAKCTQWLIKGYCNDSTWKPFMMDSCAKTCEFCQDLEEEISA